MPQIEPLAPRVDVAREFRSTLVDSEVSMPMAPHEKYMLRKTPRPTSSCTVQVISKRKCKGNYVYQQRVPMIHKNTMLRARCLRP